MLSVGGPERDESWPVPINLCILEFMRITGDAVGTDLNRCGRVGAQVQNPGIRSFITRPHVAYDELIGIPKEENRVGVDFSRPAALGG
ncbi:hypothetical protein MAIC_11670 [Mycolicibacterium aichiense]|uniref:Uncharacterized protein n=1 Tax=Mycolicibacterium aichiense TaxID=1799 RepID=A0AAD1MBJ5_9MYCO|nr:hypothetical protein MAIC_11670 [Mycolicibacterium aichiense]